MSFQVIAGSGHCGTMWLARVLDSVPGQRWFHELRTQVTGMPWQVADEYIPNSPAFDFYWSKISSEMKANNAVGDSNSWPPESLPAVNEHFQIDRVIYLTRNKVKQMYSLATQSPVWSNKPWPEAAFLRLDRYTQISGREWGIHLLVEANDFMPAWLREQGLTVDMYSLEELTTDVNKLRELAPLPDDELRAWQKCDINRKVPA